MPPLADVQSRVYRALTGAGSDGIAALLSGTRHPEKRFAIHRRHVEASLVDALLQKFPATAWLIGTPLLADTALAFVRRHPPTAPCIAEYGQGFPGFLAATRDASALPYLLGFSELEWNIGQVSVAIDEPSLTTAALSSIDPAVLPDLTLRLQPGIRYLECAWPVDELMRLFLSSSAPARFALQCEQIRLELRGARGEFDFVRLDPAEFAFRHAVVEGATVAAAAEAAFGANADFDLTGAFSRLFASRLVVAVTAQQTPGSIQ